MISLYNNQTNKRMKFKMNIVGVESEKVNPRIIIESLDRKKAFLINGIIEGDVCYFDIPGLPMFEKGESGTIHYEAIVEEDQYAKLWADKYDIVTKTELSVVENNLTEEVKDKPKISLDSGNEPMFEEIEDSDDLPDFKSFINKNKK